MARRQGRPDPKEAALAGARCLNPHPEQVTDAAPIFEVVVERSHAEYLWLWLQDAAREFAAGAIR